jgi:dolichol-phosphate mannosyltransferase
MISIIVPVHNEEASLPLLFEQLQKTAKELHESFEYIFVDDGSEDGSRQVLAGFESADHSVHVVEFSRNFGKEIALTAGLQAAKGDAAILIDADLQHPIERIPEFIRKWQEGAEVVVGVRRRYGREPLFKRVSSWLFYKIMNKVSTYPVTPHATDFRLLDRVVIDAFNQLSERNRMTRGLIDWLGFRRSYVYFKSSDRMYGEATYSVGKLFSLAINSFVSLSLFPLRLAGWLGIVITLCAGAAGLFIFIEDYLLHDPLGLDFSGPAVLAIINMFWIGIVLISIGLVALYIANIHAEVINRPLYVVRPAKGGAHAPTHTEDARREHGKGISKIN